MTGGVKNGSPRTSERSALNASDLEKLKSLEGKWFALNKKIIIIHSTIYELIISHNLLLIE